MRLTQILKSQSFLVPHGCIYACNPIQHPFVIPPGLANDLVEHIELDSARGVLFPLRVPYSQSLPLNELQLVSISSLGSGANINGNAFRFP